MRIRRLRVVYSAHRHPPRCLLCTSISTRSKPWARVKQKGLRRVYNQLWHNQSFLDPAPSTDILSRTVPMYSCPISCLEYEDPVIASDCHTYERSFIEDWFAQCTRDGRPPTSPLTRELMSNHLRVNEPIKEGLEWLKSVRNSGLNLQAAPETIKKDREIVIAAVSQNIQAFEFAHEFLRKDKVFARQVLEIEGMSLAYIDESLKGDHDVVLFAVMQNGLSLQFATSGLRMVRDIAAAAVLQNGLALEFASAFQDDEALVLVAVKKNGLALKFAGDQLKKTPKVVMAAIFQNTAALDYACDSLKRDEDFCLQASQSHKSEPKFMREYVKINGLALKFASEDLKNDREIVMLAVSNDGRALQFASESLRADRQIVMTAVCQNGLALDFFHWELDLNHDIVESAVRQNGLALQYASKKFKGLKDIALVAVQQNGLALQFVCEEQKWDKDVVFSAVGTNGLALQYAAFLLKQDKEIVMKAVRQNGLSLAFASEGLINDKQVVVAAACQNPESLRYAADTRAMALAIAQETNYLFDLFPNKSYSRCKEFMLSAVQTNGLALKYALKQDEDLTVAALESNGLALEHVSDSLKQSRDIVLFAVQCDGRSLQYADECLRSDLEIVNAAVSNTGMALQYAAETFKTDREIVLKAVAKDGLALQFAHEDLKADLSIVSAAMQSDIAAISFAALRIKEDADVIRAAVLKNGLMLKYAGQTLQSDLEVVRLAVQQNGLALQFASQSLRNRSEICGTAVLQNGLALEFVSSELRRDCELLLIKQLQLIMDQKQRETRKNFYLWRWVLAGEIPNHSATFPTAKVMNVVLAGVKNNVHTIQCVSENLRANRDFMLYAAYLHDERAFKYVSEELREDRLFFSRVLEINGLFLQFAHETLRKDEKLVMEAVKENGLAIQFASDNFRRNRNVVQIAVETSGLALQHVSHEFNSDAAIVAAAIRNNGLAFQYASPDLRKDIDYATIAINQNGRAYNFVSDALKKKEKLINLALKSNEMKADACFILSASRFVPSVISKACDVLKHDRKFIISAVEQNPFLLKNVVKEFKGDVGLLQIGILRMGKENVDQIFDDWFMSQALQQNCQTIQFFSGINLRDKLTDWESTLQKVVSMNGMLLEFTTEEGMKNEALVTKAIEQNGLALQFAQLSSWKQEKQSSLIRAAVSQNGMALKYVLGMPHFARKREFMYEMFKLAVSTNGLALQFAKPDFDELLNDETIVLLAVKNDGLSLEFASHVMRGSTNIVAAAIHQNPHAFRFATDDIKNSEFWVNNAFERNHMTLQYASESIKTNKCFMLRLVGINGLALQYACNEFRKSIDVVSSAVSQNPLALECVREEFFTKKGISGIVFSVLEQNGLCLKYLPNDLKSRNDLVLVAVQSNGVALKYAPEALQKDEKIVCAAVNKSGLALKYASKEFGRRIDLVLVAVQQQGNALQYASTLLKGNKMVVLSAVKSSGTALQFASRALQADPDVVLSAALQNRCALKYASEIFFCNLASLSSLLTSDGLALSMFPKKLQGDKEIVLTALKQNGNALQYASESIRRDRFFVLEAVKQNGVAIQHTLEESFKEDVSLLHTAVQKDADAMEFAADSLKNDVTTMLQLVAVNGLTLKHATEKIKANRDVVMQAVRQNGESIKFASSFLKGDTGLLSVVSPVLREDRDFMEGCIQKNGLALEFASKNLQADANFVLIAVKSNGLALQYASTSLKNNMKIAETAAKENGLSLQYVHSELEIPSEHETIQGLPKLQSLRWGLNFCNAESQIRCLCGMKKIVVFAVQQNGNALQHAMDWFKGQRDIVMAAVQQNGLALRYASEELKMDKDIVMASVINNGTALLFSPLKFRQEKNVVMLAVNQNGLCLKYASKELYGDSDLLERAFQALHAKQTLQLFEFFPVFLSFMKDAVQINGLALKYASEALQCDKSIVLAAVHQNGLALKHAAAILKGDKEVVMAAAAQNGQALLHASEKLKGDLDVLALLKDGDEIRSDSGFWLKAVNQNGAALQFASKELQADSNIVTVAVRNDGSAIRYASKELLGDSNLFSILPDDLRKDYMLILNAVVQNGMILMYASEELKSDRSIVLAAVNQNGLALKHAAAILKGDKEVVMAAAAQNGQAILHASEKLKGDLDVLALLSDEDEIRSDSGFWLKAVNQNGAALQFASKELQADSNIVTVAVRNDGSAIRYASKELLGNLSLLAMVPIELKANRSFMLDAVVHNGLALQLCPPELINDRSFVMTAVQKTGLALQYASQILKQDLAVVLEAVKADRRALSCVPDICKDRDFIIAVVQQEGLALQYAPKEFQDDSTVVSVAVEQNGLALEYADKKLQGVSTLVLQAVKQNGLALQFAERSIQGEKDIVSAAVMQTFDSLEYASADLKSDREYIHSLVKVAGRAIQYVSDFLKDDKGIVLEAVRNDAFALQYASNNLKGDISIVSSAVQLDHDVLCYSKRPQHLQKKWYELEAQSDALIKSADSRQEEPISEVLNRSGERETNIIPCKLPWEIVCECDDDVTPEKIPEKLKQSLQLGLFPVSQPSLLPFELIEIPWEYGDLQHPIYPCLLKVIKILKPKKPLILGVQVVDGELHLGTPLVFVDVEWTGNDTTQQPLRTLLPVGTVTMIQKDGKTIKLATKETDSIGIQLNADENLLEVHGISRFREGCLLTSHFSRENIELLKQHHHDKKLAVPKHHWKLVKSLVKVFNVPKASVLHTLWYVDLKANETGAQHTILRLWNTVNGMDRLHELRSKFEHDELIANKRLNLQNFEKWRIEKRQTEESGVFEPKKSRADFKLLLDGMLIATCTDLKQLIAFCSACVTKSGVVLSEEQISVIACKTSCFIQGRSGTGKTLVMIVKIMVEQILALTAGERPRRILFTSQSSLLCEWVTQELRKCFISLSDKLETTDSFTSAECKSWNELICESGLENKCIGRYISFEVFLEEFWRPERPPKPANYMNPNIVWAEINTVIRSSHSPLSKEQYLSGFSSASGVQLSLSEKESIYETFELYQGFKRCSHGYSKLITTSYDAVDVALGLLHNLKIERSHQPNALNLSRGYDIVMVDEVQDFIPVQLQFLMELCNSNEGCVFGGDTCQTINIGSAFSFKDLQKIFMASKGTTALPQVYTLSDNFRSQSGVVNLANRLVNLLQDTFPQSFEKITDEAGRVVLEKSHEVGYTPLFIQVLDLVSEGKAIQQRAINDVVGKRTKESDERNIEQLTSIKCQQDEMRQRKIESLKDAENKLLRLKQGKKQGQTSFQQLIAELEAQIQRLHKELDVLGLNDLLRCCLRIKATAYCCNDELVDGTIDVSGRLNRKFCVDRDFGLIIVRDDSSRNRIKNIMDGTILTPYEAKGLERDEVIIVDFFSHKDAGLLWSVASSEILRLGEVIKRHNEGVQDLTKEELKKLHKIFPAIHEIKQLYVAVTRARKKCTFIEVDGASFHKCQHFLQYCQSVLEIVDSSENVEVFRPSITNSISCDDALEKARRIRYNGEELWRRACDEELIKWKLHKQAVGCFEQAESILAEVNHEEYTGDRQEILRLAVIITRHKLRAKADHARCKATFGYQLSGLKQLKHLRKAAERYLEICDTELAASCYRQAGLVGHEGNDYRQSGLCCLLSKSASSVQISLITFLEGDLYFEAASMIENSKYFAQATKTDSLQSILQSRYLETFSECHLIISEIIKQNLEDLNGNFEALFSMLSVAVDQMRLLALFPEILLLERISSESASPSVGSSPISLFVLNLKKMEAGKKKLCLKLLCDDSDICDADQFSGKDLGTVLDPIRVRKRKLTWFSSLFRYCLCLTVKPGVADKLSSLPFGTSLLTDLFDVAWISCNKNISILHACHVSITRLVFQALLKTFVSQEYELQQMKQIHESSITDADDCSLRYLYCLDVFCSKFLHCIHQSDVQLCDALPYDLIEKSMDFNKILLTEIFLNLMVLHNMTFECTFQEGKKQLESESLNGKYLSFLAKAETFITEDIWFLIKYLRAKIAEPRSVG